MSKYWVLVGSYLPFISVLQFTTSPPSLSFISQTQVGNSPTWLVAAPTSQGNTTTIYAADEYWNGGFIRSLGFNTGTGQLTSISSVPAKGASTTHIALLNNGSTIAGANYGGQGAFFVDLNASGGSTFNGAGTLLSFQGSGPQPNQGQARPHQVRRPMPSISGALTQL